MQSAARINDLHACADGGPNPGADLEIKQGSPNILINGLPAARVGDQVTCHMSTAPTTIATGAPNVLFNGKPAARMGDSVATGGSICQGSSNVFIGDGECLISIGDSIQVELGNSCMIYFNCGDDAPNQSQMPPTTTPPPLISKSSLEKGIGIGLMVLGTPLDEIGVGEAMQAGGIALREAAEVTETEVTTAAEETAVTEETSAEKKVAEDATTQTTDKTTTPKGPTAGSAKIQECSLPKPKGVPDHWTKKTTKKNNGDAYINPKNPHERVRVMPGNPLSSNPFQQNPYVVYQQNGKAFDIYGNLLDTDDPAVHIPYDDFDFSTYK